ncbi:peptidylprolyl isomerase [uncultured Cytophaga sp.]|uniref:peptidylprolyl isomerase n=1 Tax=uncultured Cytophaga sp. TaxID=160238 RepID=UPI00260541FF|nr:peptidylprolyl isomerase [uncultured Cytophaga sp.]
MKNLLIILIASFLVLACEPSAQQCGGVEASHILIMASSPEELVAAQDTADVIIAKLQKGESFEKLAAHYGSDGTKDKGGHLGWFTRGAMVQPFEDSCFSVAVNKPTTVKTQFGVHVINVNEKSPSCK